MDGARQRYALQGDAALKRHHIDDIKIIPEDDFGQVRTPLECLRGYVGHGRGQGYPLQRGRTIELIHPDRYKILIETHFLHFGLAKRHLSDLGAVFRDLVHFILPLTRICVQNHTIGYGTVEFEKASVIHEISLILYGCDEARQTRTAVECTVIHVVQALGYIYGRQGNTALERLIPDVDGGGKQIVSGRIYIQGLTAGECTLLYRHDHAAVIFFDFERSEIRT